jgi:hypothetical protein
MDLVANYASRRYAIDNRLDAGGTILEEANVELKDSYLDLNTEIHRRDALKEWQKVNRAQQEVAVQR